FWSCFNTSIKMNKHAVNGKQRILSIIANNFEWYEIQEKLKILNDLIDATKKYFRINKADCIALSKPIVTQSQISDVKD
ncbi:23454_t:CDS:2, partial [Cetraspora pellucida]